MVQSMIYCEICQAFIEERKLSDHVERIHVSPPDKDQVRLQCGDCPFAVPFTNISTIIRHTILVKHAVEKVGIIWNEFWDLEEVRIREILSIGRTILSDNEEAVEQEATVETATGTGLWSTNRDHSINWATDNESLDDPDTVSNDVEQLPPDNGIVGYQEEEDEYMDEIELLRKNRITMRPPTPRPIEKTKNKTLEDVEIKEEFLDEAEPELEHMLETIREDSSKAGSKEKANRSGPTLNATKLKASIEKYSPFVEKPRAAKRSKIDDAESILSRSLSQSFEGGKEAISLEISPRLRRLEKRKKNLLDRRLLNGHCENSFEKNRANTTGSNSRRKQRLETLVDTERLYIVKHVE